MRRASWKVRVPTPTECPQCKAPRLPHIVCPSCGFYNGTLVVAKKEKKKTQENQQGEQK